MESVLNRSVFFENLKFIDGKFRMDGFSAEVKLTKCLRCGAVIDKDFKKEHKSMHKTIDTIVDELRI